MDPYFEGLAARLHEEVRGVHELGSRWEGPT